ncbi:hypothetical protein ACQ5TV_05600 [Acetobacter ghanensis]|uniref:hypothetical protein n=1 Tax=Acetobacter ghanensis TaxID=431306 RepID=UPI003D33747F
MTDTVQAQATIAPPNGFSWKASEIKDGAGDQAKIITGFEVTYEAEGKKHTVFFVDRLALSKSIAATEVFGPPKTERGALALSAAIRMDTFDGAPMPVITGRKSIDQAMDRLGDEGLEAFICALIERSKQGAGNQGEQDIDTAGN